MPRWHVIRPAIRDFESNLQSVAVMLDLMVVVERRQARLRRTERPVRESALRKRDIRRGAPPRVRFVR